MIEPPPAGRTSAGERTHMTEFYWQHGDAVEGPFTPDELRYLRARNMLGPGDRVRRGQRGEWQEVTEFAELFVDRSPAAPPVMPTAIRHRPATPHVGENTAQPAGGRPSPATPAARRIVPRPPAPLISSENRTRQRVIAGSLATLAIVLLLLWIFWPGSSGGGSGAGAGRGGQDTEGAGDQTGAGQDSRGMANASKTSQAVRTPAPPDLPPGSNGESRGGERRRPGDVILTAPEGPAPAEGTDQFLIGGGEFFGVVARGDRFVYVVDCSGSMIGEKFDAARHEVLRSAHNLLAYQKFYVIFFSDEAYPMFSDPVSGRQNAQATQPESAALPAEDANLERLRAWIQGFSIQGGTDPRQAMIAALELQPDAIFMLTDGAFEAQTVDVIRQRNDKRVAIHTIAFKDRSGEPLLRRIAEENGGEYRYVP